MFTVDEMKHTKQENELEFIYGESQQVGTYRQCVSANWIYLYFESGGREPERKNTYNEKTQILTKQGTKQQPPYKPWQQIFSMIDHQ